MSPRHGEPTEGVDEAVFFGPDPELALVTADLSAWDAAHPCEGDALCTCDDDA
jgi:hypothetical protein